MARSDGMGSVAASVTTRLCGVVCMCVLGCQRQLIDVVVVDISLLPVSLECSVQFFFMLRISPGIVNICVQLLCSTVCWCWGVV